MTKRVTKQPRASRPAPWAPLSRAWEIVSLFLLCETACALGSNLENPDVESSASVQAQPAQRPQREGKRPRRYMDSAAEADLTEGPQTKRRRQAKEPSLRVPSSESSDKALPAPPRSRSSRSSRSASVAPALRKELSTELPSGSGSSAHTHAPDNLHCPANEEHSGSSQAAADPAPKQQLSNGAMERMPEIFKYLESVEARGPVVEKLIRETLGHSKAVSQGLRGLVKQGRVFRICRGGPSDPFQYAVTR